MIQKETYLKVTDNSGAKLVRCIGLYKGKTSAKIGDIILVSVKSYNPASGIKKGSKFKALIVRSMYPFIRKENGMVFTFGDNAVVLLDDSYKLIGNRIFGSTVREIRQSFTEVTNLITKVY